MTRKLLNLSKIALLVFSISFLLGSCTKETFIENPAIETQWEIVNFEVKSGDWKWDSKDECYFFTFDFPELTEFITTDGLIRVSTPISGTYRPLEFTSYFYDAKAHYCSETVNFEYSPGFIRFNITASDLFDNVNIKEFSPKSYTFKTTLVW